VSYLIDTNVISEVRKGARCDTNVAAWYANVSGDQLYLSVLVTGEIRKGAEFARKTDAKRAQVLEAWLAGLRRLFTDRILGVSDDIADEWGRLNAIRPIAVIDGLLAATAKVHRLTFVTRNVSDVAGLGVQVLNPFAARAP
jgi:toxin FitB